MALSTAEKLSCFECLNVTYGPGGGGNSATAHIHTGFGVSLELNQMDTLRTELDTYLDNLAAGPLLKVQALVVEWDAVASLSVSLEGGVGDLSGVSYSADAERARIRERMQIYVPVMHIIDSIKRREGGAARQVSFSR